MKLTHRNDIGAYLQENYPNGVGVEVGVQKGDYSFQLLSGWTTGTLYSVDRWQHVEDYEDVANIPQDGQDKLYEETLQKLSVFEDRSVVVRKDSVEASKDFEDESLDFVYIDADHSYEGCLRDITTWYPKVRPGGVISGHDFVDKVCAAGVFGVKSAVAKFFQERFEDVKVIPCPHTWHSWMVVK